MKTSTALVGVFLSTLLCLPTATSFAQTRSQIKIDKAPKEAPFPTDLESEAEESPTPINELVEDEGTAAANKSNSPEQSQNKSADQLGTNNTRETVYKPAPQDYRKDLQKITKKGAYVYRTTPSPQNSGFSFRVGKYEPTSLANSATGNTFNQIYTDASSTIFLFDYEWQFFKGAGKLGAKIGSGFYFAQGNGFFLDNPTERSEELFTFLLFPNNLGLIYRFQYWENQLLVPYVEGGADYFTFLEMRDDQRNPKVGGALATHFSVGASLLLDFLDRSAVTSLDRETGVNHVWLTGEYKYIHGLSNRFDFTGELINAGVLVEF